jgi:hypothetical protein
VNESNTKYVGTEGQPIVNDPSLKIVSDENMYRLLRELDNQGFNAHAQRGTLDEAIANRAPEVVALDQGGKAWVFVEPDRRDQSAENTARRRAFLAIKHVLINEQTLHTQFNVVGGSGKRPSWAPRPR